MLDKRNAQGLPVNIIIIAAIALVVLIVLVAIFTGRIGIFSRELGATSDVTKNCKEINPDYELMTEEECLDKEDTTTVLSKDSVADPDMVCCVPPPESE